MLSAGASCEHAVVTNCKYVQGIYRQFSLLLTDIDSFRPDVGCTQNALGVKCCYMVITQKVDQCGNGRGQSLCC